ncbi:MAG: translocation/assembly module TamB domain-containing protein [Cellvibrionaceae bacterium]
MIGRYFSGRFSKVKKAIAAIIGVLLILYIILVLLVTSNSFSRWIVSKAQDFTPELTIDDLQGNFFSGLKINGNYYTDNMSVIFSELKLSINSRCLWKLSVCIDYIKADKIIVILTSNKEKEENPIQLPSISIPFNVAINDFEVKKITVEGSNQLGELNAIYISDNVTAKFNIKKSTVTVANLSASDRFCEWEAVARLVLDKQYPLSSVVNCRSVSNYGTASAKISGSIADLKATIHSTIDVNQFVSNKDFTDTSVVSTATIQIKPLEKNIPAEAELTLNEPVRVLANSHYLDLVSTKIQIEGFVLSPIIRLDMHVASDIHPDDIHVSSNAKFIQGELSIETLHIDLAQGEIDTNGKLELSDGISWAGNTEWNHVDLESWTIVPSSEWLTGDFSGSLTTNINYKNEIFSGTIGLSSLSGQLNKEPLSAIGQVSIDNNHFTVNEFVVTYAEDNQVEIKGDINSENSQVNVAFALKNVKALTKSYSENASGSIIGKARINGKVNSPNIHIDAKANQIRVNQWQLDHSTFLMDWNPSADKDTIKQGDVLTVKAEGIRNGSSEPTNASLVVTGGVESHVLKVDWIEPTHQKQSAGLKCSGKFPSTNTDDGYQRWVGICDELSIRYDWQGEEQIWTLTDAIEIDYAANPLEFSVSTFCVKNKNSKICNEEFVNYLDGNIASLSVAGEQLPINWAKTFLPNNLAIEGQWEFALQGSNLISDNNLTAEILAENAKILFLNDDGIRLIETGKYKQEHPLDEHIAAKIDANKIFAQWRWNNSVSGKIKEGHQITWELNTEKNGNLLGHINIIDQSLDGELITQKLQFEDLSKLIVLNQEESITGEINGQLTLTGSVDKPVFNGQLGLTEGHIESTLTPVPVKNINIDLEVTNNIASMNGTFNVNDGGGSVEGTVDWQIDSWVGELQLRAEEIALQPEPKILLTVSPDVRLTLSPDKMNVSGIITIPSARIEIEEVPEQAISESNDVVIVGEKMKNNQQQIITDVKIALGDDVVFKGFGLETNINGELSIQQQNNELLKANGVLELQKGRYKAYGQNLLIQEGDLVFVGNIENPQLRVSAIRAGITDDVTVGLLATGPIVSPRISLFSQPVMPQQAQLSYLLTGNAPGVEVTTDPTLAATEAALSYALASDVGLGFTKRAGEVLGIDDLQLTAGSSTSSADSGTQVGLSGYVTPKLMVRYGVGVFDAFNSLTLNYRLSKNLYLEVISGESSALDLLWSFELD